MAIANARACFRIAKYYPPVVQLFGPSPKSAGRTIETIFAAIGENGFCALVEDACNGQGRTAIKNR
jgi:hypothetical protein